MAPSASTCLFAQDSSPHVYFPRAEDILVDEDLLDLFRIIKVILRKKPDPAKLAKLLFCVSYALGDNVKFFRALHDDCIVFGNDKSDNAAVSAVYVPSSNTCGCPAMKEPTLSPPLSLPSDSHRSQDLFFNESSLATSPPNLHNHPTLPPVTPDVTRLRRPSIDATVRPYSCLRPQRGGNILPPLTSSHPDLEDPYPPPDIIIPRAYHSSPALVAEPATEPQQRGFYYQDGRITREPVLLQRYAEQGVLTQASLMRRRKRSSVEVDPLAIPYSVSPLSAPPKKPKTPHRHGEFEQRRDEIIARLRNVSASDLEQKAQRMTNFCLAIDAAPALPDVLPTDNDELSRLLQPSLQILADHSNMKPHQDNGMNQNGIYYNTDYYRLYLAFEQFQRHFAILFPNEVSKANADENNSNSNAGDDEHDRDGKDRERNAKMKAYRSWIEPILSKTNWAAFRRNIVVGERIMQLCKSIGQGVLLMTKELSGSKLHLTFTNNEWDEFMTGLNMGRWDETVDSNEPLVDELRRKLASRAWFSDEQPSHSSDQAGIAQPRTTTL